MKKGLKILAVVFLIAVIVSVFKDKSNGKKNETTNNLDYDLEYQKTFDSLNVLNIKYLSDKIEVFRKNGVDSTKLEAIKNKKDSLIIDKTSEYEKRIKDLSKHFSVKKDEFQNITWYKPKSVSRYYANDFYIYFGVNEGVLTKPRFVVSYTGDDWLFWKQAILLIDGVSVSYNPIEVPKRDNDGGQVYEKSDNVLYESFMSKLYLFKEAKIVKYRLQGDYYKDFTLSNQRKKDILNSLKLYELMNLLEKIKTY